MSNILVVFDVNGITREGWANKGRRTTGRKILKLRRAVCVTLYEGLRPPRYDRGLARSSESDAAMQNQFLTEPAAETKYTPPAIAQTELATVETKDAQTTQAVHAWLSKTQQQARRERKGFWGLFIFFQLFLFGPIGLSNVFPIFKNGHVNLAALALLFSPALGMATMALWINFRKPRWNVEELTRVGGVEAVGTLLEILGGPKLPRQVTPLLVALTELLPQMKASDAGLLTKGQRRLLNATLKSGFSDKFDPVLTINYRLAILKALEQVGDASAIPVVEHLANGRARTASQKALKAAAQECLPLLRVNFGGVEATKTLLRASAPENAAPETLLRPVEFTPDPNPKALLRAADSSRDTPQP